MGILPGYSRAVGLVIGTRLGQQGELVETSKGRKPLTRVVRYEKVLMHSDGDTAFQSGLDTCEVLLDGAGT
jgi:hypothetical protein